MKGKNGTVKLIASTSNIVEKRSLRPLFLLGKKVGAPCGLGLVMQITICRADRDSRLLYQKFLTGCGIKRIFLRDWGILDNF